MKFWRGGAEPLAIYACEDTACEAHCPDDVALWFS